MWNMRRIWLHLAAIFFFLTPRHQILKHISLTTTIQNVNLYFFKAQKFLFLTIVQLSFIGSSLQNSQIYMEQRKEILSEWHASKAEFLSCQREKWLMCIAISAKNNTIFAVADWEKLEFDVYTAVNKVGKLLCWVIGTFFLSNV